MKLTNNPALSLAIAFSLISAPAFAAIPKKAAAPAPQKILSGNAAVTGGLAGLGFSLKNLTVTKIGGRERVVIDIADLGGGVLKGYPGYYHAELQKDPQRLVLDFSQMPNVFLDEKTINQRLRSSQHVAKSSVLIDPTDQTLSLILDLKKSTKAQVFQVKGNKGTSRVVVDLM